MAIARIQVDLYDDAINYPIVKLPDRRYPGVLIQGDSLITLVRTADELVQVLSDCENDNALNLARELLDLLNTPIRHYENALRENGIHLPYSDQT